MISLIAHLLLLCIPGSVSSAISKYEHYILHGKNVRIDEAKSVVRLEMYDKSRSLRICTGVLISPNVTLTAAHCLLGPIKRIEVGYGANHTKDLLKIMSNEWHQLPGFNPSSNEFDLGVIILEKPIDLDLHKAIVAYSELYVKMDLSNRYLTTYGWGRTGNHFNNTPSDRLQKLEGLTLDIPLEMHLQIRDNQIGISWKGDSGGPLMDAESGKIVGILSSVEKACTCVSKKEIPKPGGFMLYTVVRWDGYLQWIQEFLKR